MTETLRQHPRDHDQTDDVPFDNLEGYGEAVRLQSQHLPQLVPAALPHVPRGQGGVFQSPEKGLGLAEETTVNVDFIENAALMGDASSPTKVLEGEVEKHVENQLWLICQHLKNVPMYVTYEQIEKSP